MTLRSARYLALPALQIVASSLLGCPQMLDDEFQPATAGAVGGGGDNGGAGGHDGLGGNDVGGTGNEPDAASSVSAPRVVGSRPAAGALGVLSDAHIELSFSTPMDTSATQAAYSSGELPARAVDFTWSDGDRVLVIAPHEPLVYAAGTDPASTMPRTYGVELGAGARDASGHPLEPFSLSFSTAREIAVTLPVVADPTSSGKYRSDATDGVAECATAEQTVCAGMGATAGTPSYRGFATFDLGELPPARLGLSSARLSLTVSVVYGTPFASLGALLVESVRFDAVDLTAFEVAARGSPATLATSGAVDDALSVDVSPFVRADAAEGTRSQFRLRFAQATSSDAGPILLGSNWPTLELHVGYLIP